MDFVTFSKISLQAAALRELVLPARYELGGVQTHYRYLLSANFKMRRAPRVTKFECNQTRARDSVTKFGSVTKFPESAMCTGLDRVNRAYYAYFVQ